MNLRTLFSTTLPVFLGYIPLGMTFGFLMVSQGIDWYVPIIFSVFVYAGAAQFLAVGLVVNHVPLLDTAIATLLMNMRHVFYGLSLFHLLPQQALKRFYFIFGITDETYSLLTATPSVTRDNSVWICAMNHSYWILGTVLGALLATSLPPLKGIEFSLTALFVILLIQQLKANPDVRMVALALLACAGASFIAPSYFLVTASALALLFLWVNFTLSRKERV
ncbi:MAG: AzlC family ABC transporter permease [Formosimonas sp.]